VEPVALPGGRDARGSLDLADADRADAVVVAAPPHPQRGGHRGDERLRAVSRALGERGVDCLRLDYGPWAEGRGERTDVLTAATWARESYARVGLFGYSFGASVALLAATEAADGGDGPAPDAVSALAPDAVLGGTDVVGAVAALPTPVPLQVVVGERDDAVDWRPVADAARARGAAVTTLSADHFFVGQAGTAGETVAAFLAPRLD
jgi:hypothetical protein